VRLREFPPSPNSHEFGYEKELTMPDDFAYDVFLSHSAQDKAVPAKPIRDFAAGGGTPQRHGVLDQIVLLVEPGEVAEHPPREARLRLRLILDVDQEAQPLVAVQ
jgi:hypothetical protein